MNLFESIDLTNKFKQGQNVTEALRSQQAKGPDPTAVALDVAKRLRESLPREDKPVQLNSFPLAN